MLTENKIKFRGDKTNANHTFFEVHQDGRKITMKGTT